MQIRPVPQQRIREKLDEYMSRRDYAGAERHLLYWLEEALQGGDLRGQLMIRNELIGHFRKTQDRRPALENVEEALHLLQVLDFENSISAGTTCVNAATACSAFGEFQRAAELFEQARQIYEGGAGAPGAGAGNGAGLPQERYEADPQLLGGLYNNMALNLVALGDFAAAADFYQNALEQMRRVPNGELEQAITYLNMADALEKRDGPEAAEKEIRVLLDTAYDLLQTPTVPRDGYYAFVCEKCAPSFSYYGYFLAAEELQRTAEKLYQA